MQINQNNIEIYTGSAYSLHLVQRQQGNSLITKGEYSGVKFRTIFIYWSKKSNTTTKNSVIQNPIKCPSID